MITFSFLFFTLFFILFFFEDLLIPKADSPPLHLGGVVKHMHLPLYFKKFDPETERYGVATAIRFCFPSKSVDTFHSSAVDKNPLDDDNDANDTASSSSSSSSSSASILSKFHIEEAVRKSPSTMNSVTVECNEKKNFNDIHDEDGDHSMSDKNRKQAKKEKEIAELRAFKTIELLLLEMYFVIKESFARTNFQNAVEKKTDLGINHAVTESHDNDDDDSAHNSKSIFSDIMKKATMGRRQVIVEDIKMDDLYSLLKASER